MKMTKRYKIVVKTLTGKILTYNPDNYSVEDGFVCWFDLIDKETKKYPSLNCEITEKKIKEVEENE